MDSVIPHGGGSVIKRGGICADTKLDLVIFEGNINAQICRHQPAISNYAVPSRT